ncbi:MAG TPA: pyruvate synthase subunit beta [Candidatus Aenigmarchaeota archaeon]|nr:pyruvate synthase subunit beta [Candidatus Aenigmarchaeota archaeon]
MKEIKTINDVPKQELVVGGGPLCMGCSAALGLKLALKALGKNTIVINASGCMTLFATYPYMPTKVPWLHIAIENAAAGATGIKAALKQLKKGRNVNILCYAGDGATYDIGLQALSGACERRDDFIYVCYNNQSFSNTGVQMSSATPPGAYTTTTYPSRKNPLGNTLIRKSLIKIMAAHGIPYAATACISFPLDYMRKLQKAARIEGPKVIDLLCPCPTGWGFDPSKAIEVGNLAVRTGAWPLYEIENGKFNLTFKTINLLPIKRYFSMQRRFHHLGERQIAEIQAMVKKEWDMLLQGRFWEAVEY